MFEHRPRSHTWSLHFCKDGSSLICISCNCSLPQEQRRASVSEAAVPDDSTCKVHRQPSSSSTQNSLPQISKHTPAHCGTSKHAKSETCDDGCVHAGKLWGQTLPLVKGSSRVCPQSFPHAKFTGCNPRAPSSKHSGNPTVLRALWTHPINGNRMSPREQRRQH